MVWTNGPVELYHGTTDAVTASIRTAINPSKGAIFADFGRGFYCTSNLQQAKDWANTRVRPGQRAEVIAFECDLDTIAGLEVLSFVIDSQASGFRDFVTYCRNAFHTATWQHPDHMRSNRKTYYDVVFGPVVLWPQHGLLSGYDQISFHGSQSIAALKPLPQTIIGNPVF